MAAATRRRRSSQRHEKIVKCARDAFSIVGLSLRSGQDLEVILMDEPASALDPIATSRIEDLILELKKDFTIVIVTHNMQQAARISDHTAFFYIGELVEFGPTGKIFTNPTQKRTEDYVSGRFG